MVETMTERFQKISRDFGNALKIAINVSKKANMKLAEFEGDFMVEECLPAKRARKRKLPFDESPGNDTDSSGPYETLNVGVFSIILDQVWEA